MPTMKDRRARGMGASGSFSIGRNFTQAAISALKCDHFATENDIRLCRLRADALLRANRRASHRAGLVPHAAGS